MPAACQSFLLHPSTFAFRGFEGAKRQRLCQPSGSPLGPNLAGVSLFRMRAHRWRWGLWRAFGMADAARFCWGPLRPPNQCLPDGAVTCLWNGWCRTALLRAVTFAQPMPAACQIQSFLSHPSTFAFSGLEGAKQQRLCRPSGNPVGVNLAGVSLFRMRAHGWRWGLWRAFGMADAARFCSGPLRPPNQCLLLAKASCFNRPPWLLVGVKVPNGSGSADLVAGGRESCWGFRVSDACSRVTLGAMTCPWNGWCRTVLVRAVTFAQPMPAACQSSLLRPSTFAFKGFEGAKRQRLCQPSGNPLGPNLAGVSLFRMRAHRWRWGLWRAFGMADAARFCWGPLRPPNQCLPDGAVTCLWNGWCRTVLLRAVTSPNQCLLLAKASCLTLPPLLLVGGKVPNGSGADQVATRWAWILLGFPCFGCVLTGDAGGCDVPLEWLMPHGFAQGRYVRPTNACRLPKLPASTVHLGF